MALVMAILCTLSIRYFTEAVFDIHNCINITVSDCYFLNNYGTGIIPQPYRGNTGALAITYNDMDTSLDNPNIAIENCTFDNNYVTTRDRAAGLADQVFATSIFKGRAGGIAIFVREDHFNITATISNCLMSNNSAQFYGGSTYILFGGDRAHVANVIDTIFESNHAEEGGGGMIILGTRGQEANPHIFQVHRCLFRSNVAKLASGLYYSINLNGEKTNIIQIADCTFVNNKLLNRTVGFGSAFVVDVAIVHEEKESFPLNTLSNW